MGLVDSIPIIGPVLQYQGQREANRTNAQIASDANDASKQMSKEQMAFQERMSSTAHQREVEDLRKAGINPILSRNAGASTPAGAMGEVKTAHMESALGKAATSAMEAMALRNTLKKGEKEMALLDAQKLSQEASANRDNTTAKATAVNTKIQELLAPGQILKSTAEGSQSKNYIDNKTFYNMNNMIREGLGTANSAKDLLMPLRSNGIKLKKNEAHINTNTGEILNER